MIVSGYAAKNMCSCIFVVGMDEKIIKEKELNFDFNTWVVEIINSIV